VPPQSSASVRGASASREASRSNLRSSASESLLGTEDYLSSRHTTPRMAPPRQKPLHAAGNELPGMRPWSPSGVAPVSARSERSPPARYRQMSERMANILAGDDRGGPAALDEGLRRSPSRNAGIMARADEMDDMWCTVLQRFPQYPDWVLVKEKAGVYRMGGAGGKKILCRISHGGLQVRVGGGWMNAINFLERHGPTGMGVRSGDETPTRETASRRGGDDIALIGTSPSMERLLVPTKCWAQKIGINTTPDIREQRQLASAEEAREERRQTYTEDARIAAQQPELGNEFWRVRKLVRDGADLQESTASLPKRAGPGIDVQPGSQVPSRVSGSASTAMSSVVESPMVLNAGPPQSASSAPTPRPGLPPAAGPLASVVLSSGSMQAGMQGMPSPARNGMNTGSLRAPVMQPQMQAMPTQMGPVLDASQFVQTGNSWRFANDPAMRSPARSLSPYAMVNGAPTNRTVSPYAPM